MYKTSRDLERLADEHTKVMHELDKMQIKLNAVQNEKDELQKKLTKQVKIYIFVKKNIALSSISTFCFIRFKCMIMKPN